MSNLATQETISNLVLKAKELVTDNQGTPRNWADLKHLAQQMELQEYVQKLEELLDNEALMANPELFLEAFKQLCQERVQRNSNSCLSFIALPQGACNQLYWDIAKCIFNPETLGEILAILLPQNCRILTVEEKLANSSAKKRLPDITLHFKLTDLASLMKPANQTSFPPHLVLANKVLFDINCIINYDFLLHQKFYEKLSSDYPALAKELYRHNHQLQQLFVDIQLVARKGQTAREAFNRLAREFALGGSKITGHEFASDAAETAYLHCKEYLQSLPAELKDKVLELEGGSSQMNTSKILTDLQEGRCVETAAHDLRTILNNTANNCILDTVPALKDCEKKNIIQRYNSRSDTSHLQAEGHAKTTAIPSYWLEKLLSRIEIKTAEHYLDLLLFFPIKYYPTLLKYATITCLPIFPEGLKEMIAAKILNPEQLAAFNRAITQNLQKFGIRNTISFAGASNNPNLLTEILGTLNSPAAIKAKDMGKKPLLYYCISNLDFLQTILGNLSEEDRIDLVKQGDEDGCTVLHYVRDYPNSLQAILQLLPEKKRATVVKLKNTAGNTLLHFAAENIDSLEVALESLPEKNRLNAMQEKNNDGDTPFELLRYTADTLQLALSLLPEEDRLAAVKLRNQQDLPLMHLIYSDAHTLKAVLALLPQNERLNVLNEKNNVGETALQNILQYLEFDSLKVVLQSLPEKDRFEAIKGKSASGNALMGLAITRPDVLQVVCTNLSTNGEALYNEFNSLNETYNASNKELFIKSLKKKIITHFNELSTAEKLFLTAKNIDFAEVQLQKQDEFLKQITPLHAKATELTLRGHSQAGSTMENLYTTLKTYANAYFVNEIDKQSFRELSMDAINNARPELEKHRGMKRLGGNFLFFTTDSANKLDHLINLINDVAPPCASRTLV